MNITFVLSEVGCGENEVSQRRYKDLSRISMIACDYPLPPTDMRDMRTEGVISCIMGFMISPQDLTYNRGSTGAIMVDEHIKTEFKYRFSIEADDLCFKQLREYLNINMKNNSMVELWGLWLGISTNTDTIAKPHVKHLSSDEINDYEDAIAYYYGKRIKRRKVTLHEMTVNDLSFYTENQNVCLTIVKKCQGDCSRALKKCPGRT